MRPVGRETPKDVEVPPGIKHELIQIPSAARGAARTRKLAYLLLSDSVRTANGRGSDFIGAGQARIISIQPAVHVAAVQKPSLRETARCRQFQGIVVPDSLWRREYLSSQPVP